MDIIGPCLAEALQFGIKYYKFHSLSSKYVHSTPLESPWSNSSLVSTGCTLIEAEECNLGEIDSHAPLYVDYYFETYPNYHSWLEGLHYVENSKSFLKL